ncbi:sigma 54-interacting transcriptional regulator [Pseudomonas sp. RL_5y_Pfl2_69]|uniref:sigma 54-interacting transcriptional regulator n=1 Tax=Pseudomonas sp. RL_5y_Pfl2_69 TaxID=3088711 RepID=UPI0030D7B088
MASSHSRDEHYQAYQFEDPELDATINSTATLNIDILLYGETGTGKDTLAERLHSLSGRRGHYIAINCAAIPESLAESQLFGVTHGAFTGAMQSRAGFIEASDMGTLYLDEIDSMPLILQAKLLRVLETRGVERLGSTRSIPVDMRVIASAQSSLSEMVEQGRFRRDLYYRLNVVSLHLPPLRERREHIIPLFLNLIQREANYFNSSIPVPSTSLLQRVICHDWPGNVRELRSVAKRLVLGLPPLLTCSGANNNDEKSLKLRLQQIEKLIIQDSLRRHLYSLDAVVLELGVAKRTLYHRMKQLEIS